MKNDRGVFRGHSGIWVCFLSGPLSGCAAFASVSATGCRTFCHPSDPGLFPGCPASFFARDAFHAGTATAGVGGGNSLCRCGKQKRFASAGKVFLHRHRARKQSAGGGVRCETFTGCEQHTSAGKVFCTGTERVGVSAQRFFRRCIFRGVRKQCGKGADQRAAFFFLTTARMTKRVATIRTTEIGSAIHAFGTKPAMM